MLAANIRAPSRPSSKQSSGNKSVPAVSGAVGEAEADALFADLVAEPALVLAISGGPDSTALLYLMARWCAVRQPAPHLLAVSIDHGLRPEARHEAAAVKRLAEKLGVEHRTMRWTGAKPSTGIQEAARVARYRLLRTAAHRAKHVVLVRPLLEVPKGRLIVTLQKAGLFYAEDPSNVDPRFARSRLRK